MRLAGRTALVTGGGTGIGRAIAAAFVAEGCRVVIAGRREEKLREACAVIESEVGGGKAGKVSYKVCDVAERAQVRELVEFASERMGRVDILVNNAGTNLKRRALRVLEPEDWDHMIAANLTGAYNCIHEVLPQMRERRDGVIINISSTAGVRATSLGGAAYSAAKFGLGALATVVGQEEMESNIRVSVICPGEVDTPLLEARPEPVSEERRRRALRPEDVAAAALFVATLPARASVPELIIKPRMQGFA